MGMREMRERKAFLLRMDPALFDALEEWAAQELRSLNGQIEYVLKEAVRRRGRPLDENKEARNSRRKDS
jgi:hypothetical protein